MDIFHFLSMSEFIPVFLYEIFQMRQNEIKQKKYHILVEIKQWTI